MRPKRKITSVGARDSTSKRLERHPFMKMGVQEVESEPVATRELYVR
jgi:hypothetical protein